MEDMLNYQLRPMKVEDIDEIVEGEMEVFGHSLGYDFIYADFTLNPFSHYIVLEINQKVKGYIGFWINDHMEIINFYVDSDVQNQGFGAMMLTFALEVCRKSHIENISLEVRKSNKRAIHLYEKFGFKQEAIRKQYYDNGEDALLMVRKLEVNE